jgi:hypothetical protein
MKAIKHSHLLIGAALSASGLLFWATGAHAADKPVPWRVCLTMEQAIATYKGKKIGTPRYRQIGKDKCWYIASKTPAKSEFIVPRATGVAVTPARLPNKEQQRVQAVPVGSIPAAGALSYSADDYESGLAGAFEALCGGPCPQLLKFEDRWKLK